MASGNPDRERAVKEERFCQAPSLMAAPSSFVGEGDYDRLLVLRDEIIESCLTEQRCSVNLSCVTFRFVLLLVRPLCC